MNPLPPTGNAKLDALRAYHRAASKRWREKHPDKVREARRRKRERVKADPRALEARRKWQARYAQKRKFDPQWIERQRKNQRKCYEKLKRDPDRLEKRKEQRRKLYLKYRDDPVRRARRRERDRIWSRKRRRENPEYAVRANLRSRLKSCLYRARGGCRGRRHTIEYLGCTLDELVRHLEHQFKRGMRWANYGNVWHIDHIVPCAKFDMLDPRQQRICFNYLNLRPCFARENIQKQDRILHPAQLPLGI